MTKTEALELLFEQWENYQSSEPDYLWKQTNGGNPNISRDHFRRDGIIDEPTFETERIKVLFISNEANDNGYSAKTQQKTNTVEDYREFYRTGHDNWKGKMRYRVSALYKVIAGIDDEAISNSDAALNYAVMDLNKRGGGADIHGGDHLKAYCHEYESFIRREINIIDPDIIAWLATNTYDAGIPEKCLGAYVHGDKKYLRLGSGRVIPILDLWHTSYIGARIAPAEGYQDKTIGKQVARCLDELEKFGISRKKDRNNTSNQDSVDSIKEKLSSKPIEKKSTSEKVISESSQSKFKNREAASVIAIMPDYLRDLLEKAQVYLLSLSDDVIQIEAQRYFSYKAGQTFAVIIPDRTRVIINLMVDPSTVEIDNSFTRDLQGKHSYGSAALQLQLFVRNEQQLEKAKEYMQAAFYESRKI